MKCKFCGSIKTVNKLRQDEAILEFNTRLQILHRNDCIIHLSEKELLMMILERLTNECNLHNPS